MNDPQASMEQFELDYNNALAMLAERHPDDESVDSLLVAEESRPNMGTEVTLLTGFSPLWQWLQILLKINSCGWPPARAASRR